MVNTHNNGMFFQAPHLFQLISTYDYTYKDVLTPFFNVSNEIKGVSEGGWPAGRSPADLSLCKPCETRMPGVTSRQL